MIYSASKIILFPQTNAQPPLKELHAVAWQAMHVAVLLLLWLVRKLAVVRVTIVGM